MRRALITLSLAGVVAAGGLALARDTRAFALPWGGYLGAEAPDTYAILPPAPKPGTIRYQADRSAFLATRALKDTPRWALATSDAAQSVPVILKDMSCAAGVELTPQDAPKLAALLGRVTPDIRRAVDRPKHLYKRPRPFLVDDGPVCTSKPGTYDYPSGHTTYGWTMGLILAELFPDRATQILQRARAYGESRMVCGVHNMSAVETGRMNGSIVVAGLHGSAVFRADMDEVRQEVEGLRKTGEAPDAAACAAEAEALAKSPYS